MADKENKRIRPNILQEDLAAYAALQAIPGYNPSNKDYELSKITAAVTAMKQNQTEEIQINAAAEAKRDDTTSSEWRVHNAVLGAKDQVKAQYGVNSNEYASLGMKKKTEYKAGGRKPSGEPKK